MLSILPGQRKIINTAAYPQQDGINQFVSRKEWRDANTIYVLLHFCVCGPRFEAAGSGQHFRQNVNVANGIQEHTWTAQYPMYRLVYRRLILEWLGTPRRGK